MKGFADCHLHLHDGNVDGARHFLDVVADCGVTDASLLCIPCSPDYSQEENFWALSLKKIYDRIKLRVFGSFYETGALGRIPYEEQTRNLLDMGCDGIKFLQMKPDLRKKLGRGIDHPDYDAAFELLERKRIPVLLHSGDPEDMWDISTRTEEQLAKGAYYDDSFPSSEEIYAEVFRRLDKNPRLNITVAHFFFLSNFPDRAAAVMEKYPNIRFDLTPGWEMFLGFSENIERWHDFFEKYSDRILFGTDSNNRKKDRINTELNRLVYTAVSHDTSEFEIPCYGRILRIKGLGLCEETVEKICYGNYISFVGEN